MSGHPSQLPATRGQLAERARCTRGAAAEHHRRGNSDAAWALFEVAVDLERRSETSAPPPPPSAPERDHAADDGWEDDRGAGDFTRSCVWGALLGLVVWTMLIVGIWEVLR